MTVSDASYADMDVSADEPLDPADVTVGPGEAVRFLLGFPAVPYSGRGDVAVGLRLAGGPAPMEAESPVPLVRRIPER